MPAPVAVTAAFPIAVLMLAWDEAAPAVRALIAATKANAPTVDSILVMVPQAIAPTHLNAEKHLPVSLPPPRLAALPEPQLAAAEPAPPAAISRFNSEILELQLTTNEQVALLQSQPVSAAPASLAWAAVRVLRLGSLSLPQLAQRADQPLPAPTWTGSITSPAAPYLGASEPGGQPELAVTDSKSGFDTKDFVAQNSQATPLAATAPPTGTLPEANTAPHYEPDEAAQAPDPEADLLPHVADEPADVESPPSYLAEGGAGILSLPRHPARAGWPEALAALQRPATLPTPPKAASTGSVVAQVPVADLNPAHYPAPDLNFQIIQYARFAVPVALAESPFAVIYAPAWPTWLAAQELRQRTGQPLVLHVATLAAADDESVDIATGWIAELQRQALRRADLVLTETPALAQRLRHELRLAFEMVQAVPATDTEAIAQALRGAQPRPPANLT